MLGKSPIKCRQRPDMTIAVDWVVKHQFKQTNQMVLLHLSRVMREPKFCLCENKGADSCIVTAQLINAFVLATWIVQFLLKSEISSI